MVSCRDDDVGRVVHELPHETKIGGEPRIGVGDKEEVGGEKVALVGEGEGACGAKRLRLRAGMDGDREPFFADGGVDLVGKPASGEGKGGGAADGEEIEEIKKIRASANGCQWLGDVGEEGGEAGAAASSEDDGLNAIEGEGRECGAWGRLRLVG